MPARRGLPPALLFVVYSLIGLAAAIVTRATWGKQERQLAEQATRSVSIVDEREALAAKQAAR